ncbi:MAG: DUF3179 domain-containing protein [Acidobacteriota bacterium]
MKKITILSLIISVVLTLIWAEKKREMKPYTFVKGLEKTDFTRTSIDLKELYAGCPKRDCIPAISKPEFLKENPDYLKDSDRGILVTHKGESKFYPYNILVWHEIVNDSIGDLHFAVTFCPLCGTGIVFNREFNGKIHKFGVSGTLYNSNLMMYDDVTYSLWSQSGGESVVGKYNGTELELIEMQLLTYEQLKKGFPTAKIMSADTGHKRDYTKYPYGNYDLIDRLYFPVKDKNTDFPVKELFYVFKLKDKSVAVRISKFDDGRYLKKIEGKNITLIKNNGLVTIGAGGKIIPGYYEMWFSFYSTHGDKGLIWKK